MGIQLKIRNFRCLRSVDWSPDGVGLLVGPNGAGKTTLLDALSFLRLTYETSFSQAIQASGGPFFRNWDAPPQESVSFSLAEGGFTWDLNLFSGGGPVNLTIGESLRDGTETIFSKRPEDQIFDYRGRNMHAPNTALRTVTDAFPDQSPLSIVSIIKGFLVYTDYALQQLRFNGSPNSSDMQLSLNGGNAFAVLRNWLGKRDYRPAYDFVVRQLKYVFPGIADDVEFDFAGNVTSLRLVNASRAETIPVTVSSNGWLVGLLHLMAVAGARPGSVIAFDEFENSLHPYAVRQLVQAMRHWAGKKQLTIILAGHSMALLDEFREEPSRVFVMEPSNSAERSMPMRLTDYLNPEWLKQFSLGELYRHEDFGGPNGPLLSSAPALTGSQE